MTGLESGESGGNLPVEICFETVELRALCEDEELAVDELGNAAVDALKKRLADIRAADCMHDVLAGNPVAGPYGQTDCYRLELANGLRLVLVPNHANPRESTAGGTDWPRVRRVRIVALER